MADPAAIREMFSAIAPRYDLLNHLLSFGQDVRWRAAAVRVLAPRPDERALDLCGGTGDLALALARSGADTVCADFSAPMLLAAARKAERGDLPLRLILADALRLPFPDGCFDVVTMAFGLRNLRSIEEGLAEMARVLRPGGRLGILEFSRPPGRILRAGYHLYLRGLLPFIGGVVSGRGSAYRHLSTSIRSFPDQDELALRMTAAGLREVRYENLSRGIVSLHHGTRASEQDARAGGVLSDRP